MHRLLCRSSKMNVMAEEPNNNVRQTGDSLRAPAGIRATMVILPPESGRRTPVIWEITTPGVDRTLVPHLPPNLPSQRNYRGILIAFLITAVMCVLGAVPFFALRQDGNDQPSPITGAPLSFLDFFFGSLQAPSVRYLWLQEGLLSFDDGNMQIGLLRIRKDGTFEQESLRGYANNWVPSFDASYVAYSAGYEELYRYSTRAVYKIMRFENGTLTKRYHVRTRNSSSTGQKLRLFKWNPSGVDFVFVYNNDIYYRPSPDDQSDRAIRITWNGDDTDMVFSGIADWMYEEEIFHTCDALWWSPNGRYLAYATFDETHVKRMPIDYYPEQGSSLYPTRKTIPYPKVGQRIPNVTLSVWDKERREIVQLKPPEEVQQMSEYYLFSLYWSNINTWDGCSSSEPPIIVVWSNRQQTLAYVSLCCVQNGMCILNYLANNGTASNGIWLEPADFRIQYSSRDRYFLLLPSLEEDGHYYTHIAAIDIQDDGSARSVSFLTRGTWEVTEIVGYNEEISTLYFMAAYPLPRTKNLFRTSTLVNATSSPHCLTCWMAMRDPCAYMNAEFSKNGDHYVLSCDGPGVPFMILRKASANQTLYTFTNTTGLEEFLAEKALPVVNYDTVDLGDGYDANVRILYPPGYNESEQSQERFPLVQFVYGGPNSQSVWEQWIGSYAFQAYLASDHRYIVVSFDGRGSSNRGTKYKKPVYKRLGGYEVVDQITALRAFLSKSPAVDVDRMAVWGWSYGGFVTIGMIEDGAFNLYKCAAAVAPATDFRYYDAAYVERYMGLHDDDGGQEAYQGVNLLSNVSQFANGKFLLMHGTADDNVHFQHSAMLADALTRKNIQFSYMVYTNGDHSISRGRLHLYTMLDNFFEDCFK